MAAAEAAATEQGVSITKAVIEALKDKKLLVPVPELLIRLAMAGRAAARRLAYRELIRGLEPSSFDTLDQLLVERAGDRSHLGWIAEAPEGAKPKNLKGLIARLDVLRATAVSGTVAISAVPAVASIGTISARPTRSAVAAITTVDA